MKDYHIYLFFVFFIVLSAIVDLYRIGHCQDEVLGPKDHACTAGASLKRVSDQWVCTCPAKEVP